MTPFFWVTQLLKGQKEIPGCHFTKPHPLPSTPWLHKVRGDLLKGVLRQNEDEKGMDKIRADRDE